MNAAMGGKAKKWGSILDRFGGRAVAVLGDLVLDEYIYGQTERISREAPVLIVRQESTERILGGAANAAANLAGLGAATTAIGAVGDDEAGRAVQSLCAGLGIEGRLIVKPGPTETKTRILAGGINTTRQQMLRLDRGSDEPLRGEAHERLIAELRRVASEAAVLIVSDYGAGLLSEAVIAEISRLAAEGLTVCVDSRYSLAAYRGVTLAKPNEPELAAATGLKVGDEAGTLLAASRLRETLGCKAVLATRGRSGMALIEAGEAPLLIPVHGEEEAVDVTGAGDSVIATFALALAAGASLQDAAGLANVAGGLVVRKSGTATVRIEELRREVEALA